MVNVGPKTRSGTRLSRRKAAVVARKRIGEGFADNSYGSNRRRTPRWSWTKKERSDFFDLWQSFFGSKCCTCGCDIAVDDFDIEHLGRGWAFRVRNGVNPRKENFRKWLAASCRLCNRVKRTQYTGLKACIERTFRVTGKPIPFLLSVNDDAEKGEDSGWCMGCIPVV